MDGDEDDLPSVVIFSPLKVSSSDDFRMPSADVLAAGRKLEMDLDLKLEELNISTINMPNPATLASERQIEKDNNLMIDNLIKKSQANAIDVENDLSTCIEILQIDTPKVTALSENPGIDIAEMDTSILTDIVSPVPLKSLDCALSLIASSKTDDQLKMILDMITLATVEMFSNPVQTMKFEDFVTQIILSSAIILDRKCRKILPTYSPVHVLCCILQNVPGHMQSLVYYEFVCRIMRQFTHFHDRFYLGECMIRVKCDPVDLETVPAYFSTRVAKCLLQETLCDLIGHPKGGEYRNLNDLKELISKGERIQSLDMYEQYILVDIMNTLYFMIPMVPVNRALEMEAKDWLLTFFNLIRCSQQTDFLKVKKLCARLNLLWNGECENAPSEYSQKD